MLSSFQKYNLPELTNGVRLPKFDLDKNLLDEMGLPDDASDYQFLLALCLSGLEERIGKNHPKYKDYYSRMKMELDTFKELGFCSYVLITWDIVEHCRRNNIPTGVSRGSAAGSAVLYLIGVTAVDSLKYGLYFERFLNKTRAKFEEINGIKYYDGGLLFDVDLDVSFSDRIRLIKWLEEKYKGKIAKLPTISSFSTKILIKEVLKSYLGYSEEKAGEVSEMIPVHYGKPNDIDESIKESKDFADFAEKNPEIISICKKLYHLNKHFGVHASAWIISYCELNDLFPLRLTKEKELSTVYTMDDSLNLAIKVDILGLRCATLIDKVCKTIGIESKEIDINDSIIYDNLQHLRTPKGCFQIEAECNYRVVKQVKPKSIEDLSAVVALARPGALQFVESFSKYIETGEFQSIHSFFDDILSRTGGVCLYQEQVIKMAAKMGFSASEGEVLRRCIGKKDSSEMKKWQSEINKKVKENNLDSKISSIFWKICEDSAAYQFNFSHSISYAIMSAITVYLKFKYPKEFFWCLLELSKEEANTTEEIQTIQQELRFFNIKLLAPDIIKSGMGFTLEGDNIRFGLGYIKGVSDKTLDKIRNFRSEFNNKFEIFMAANEAGVNVGVLSALIQAGCLDSYINSSRSLAVLEAQSWSILTPKEKKRAIEIAKDFNFDLMKIMKHFITPNELGVRFIKESRERTIRKKYDKFKKIYDKNSKHEDLACFFYESILIGFSYSKKLSDICRAYYADIIDICEIENAESGDHVEGCGEILEVKYATSKKEKKTRYVKLLVNDTTGSMNIMLFNEAIDASEMVNEGRFVKGQIVAFSGQKKTDVIFCNKIINQEVKIVTKLAQIKEEKD